MDYCSTRTFGFLSHLLRGSRRRASCAVLLICVVITGGCDNTGSDAGAPLPPPPPEVASWSDPVEIAALADIVGVGLDDQHRGMVVWLERTSGDHGLYWRTFDPARGWGPPQLLELVPDSDGVPRFSMDERGGALLVWVNGGIRARRYDPATGWAESENLDPDLSGSSGSVAFHRSGRAIVSWSTPSAVQARRHDPDSGWGAVETVRPHEDPFYGGRVTAISRTGAALALFSAFSSSDYSTGIVSRFGNPGQPWGPDRPFDGLSRTESYRTSRDFVDATGTATLLRVVDRYVYVFHAHDDSDWVTDDVSYGSLSSVYATNDLVVADDGSAALMRAEETGIIQVRQYTPGSGWREPLQLGVFTAQGEVQRTWMSGGVRGDVVIVWSAELQSRAAPVRMESARYRPGAEWEFPPAIPPGRADAIVDSLQHTVSGDGAALAAWIEYAGEPFGSESTIRASFLPAGP